MKAALGFFLAFACLAAPPLIAETPEQDLQYIRSEFQRLGRIDMARTQVPADQRKGMPTSHKESFPLLKLPPDLLAEAIDRSLRTGGKEERIGALAVYDYATSSTVHKIPKRPDYQGLLIHLLETDDQTNLTYSGGIAYTLTRFPSRETVLAYIDAAHRAKDPETREYLLLRTSSMLQMRPPIHSEMTPVEKERTLNELQAWLERNRDRIRFKGNGQPTLAGGEADEKHLALTTEDRARIRKDPGCVLKLIEVMMGGGNAGSEGTQLAERCGTALLGPEGARKFQESLKQADAGPPSFDQQMAMASARGGYPALDAVQLAVAYVAAYEKDPGLRNLAMEIYEELGTPEIERVLKGEPREVRKKAMALVDEVNGENEDED